MAAPRFVVCVTVLFVTLFSAPVIAFKSESLTTGCPMEFKEGCSCGYVPYGETEKLTYVTNCTNTGFQHAMMLQELPVETEVLIFVGNEIKDLPLNIFGQDNPYENLHTVDLSNNQIQSIKGRTFHNVANVTKLILNDNDLYIVSKDHHPRMFSNFVQLRELHLRDAFTEKVKSGDYLSNLVEIFENSTLNHLKVLNLENNEISRISEKQFCSLPSLEELYLGDNRLADITLNFSCLPKLKKLDVGNNNISYLTNKTIKNVEKVLNLELNLTSNPFKCDCKMIKTYEWMVTTHIKLINREKFHCSDGFAPNIGKQIVQVPLDELQCSSESKRPAKLSPQETAPYIVLAVFVMIAVAIISLLIYMNKQAVHRFVVRVTEPIRNKFQYVSLDRRDETMDV